MSTMPCCSGGNSSVSIGSGEVGVSAPLADAFYSETHLNSPIASAGGPSPRRKDAKASQKAFLQCQRRHHKETTSREFRRPSPVAGCVSPPHSITCTCF